ncbi:MAG: O-antigen ligase family protein [Pseudomonadota bacterium]
MIALGLTRTHRTETYLGMLAKFALRRESAIIRILFFIVPFVTILFPKTSVGTVIILFLCCVGLHLAREGGLKDLFRIDLSLVLFGATALYLFINASWSLDMARAATSAAWFVLVILMSYGGCRALARWPERSLKMAATAFLIGISAGVAIACFEILTDRLGTLALYDNFPFTQPDSLKGFVVRDGTIVRILPGRSNAIIGVVMLSMWPALLCGVGRLDGRTRALFLVIFIPVVIATILFSAHESSKAGLILSAAAFALATPCPQLTRRALSAVWCLAFLLVIPLAALAYKADLHHNDALPFSAQARVTLWAYTATQVPEAPILGIGGSSTRKIDQSPENRSKKWKQKQKTEGFGWRAGSHAHNAFLQTWYELGAVGVILFMATGTAVILSLAQLPPGTHRYVLAHVAAFFAIIAFAWGMWQQWLMALIGLSVLYLALGTSLYRARRHETTGETG